MRVPKLTPVQNRTLGGCETIEDKLNLLEAWRQTKEIDIYQYRWFTNKWINRYKKEMLTPTPIQHQSSEITRMNVELRRGIAAKVLFPSLYITAPSKAKFIECLDRVSCYTQGNEFLALAMRCPFENLAETAGEYVAKNRMQKLPIGVSHSLWRAVWNDEYVPMDAVRLMMAHDVLASCFGKDFLLELYPLVKLHKEREFFRSTAASSHEEAVLTEKRLRAFDRLLKKIEGVCQE